MTPGNYLTPSKSFRDFMSMDPFRLLQGRPTRLFEEPFSLFRPFLPREETLQFTGWMPPCDIYETEKELVLKLELPEVKKENVHVTVDNRVLTLRGERKLEENIERENYHRIERSYGEFMRSFTLPTFVNAEKVAADFKDGVLTVTLPKTEEALPKQIEVQVE
jgi:HSP20 family protein